MQLRRDPDLIGGQPPPWQTARAHQRRVTRRWELLGGWTLAMGAWVSIAGILVHHAYLPWPVAVVLAPVIVLLACGLR